LECSFFMWMLWSKHWWYGFDMTDWINMSSTAQVDMVFGINSTSSATWLVYLCCHLLVVYWGLYLKATAIYQHLQKLSNNSYNVTMAKCRSHAHFSLCKCTISPCPLYFSFPMLYQCNGWLTWAVYVMYYCVVFPLFLIIPPGCIVIIR